MCGIFGAIAPLKSKLNGRNLSDSTRLLSHRGPDSSGEFQDDHVYFGHNRLAVFDLSSNGSQPMTRWGKTIIYNGAIYNFTELRDDLETKGYDFHSDSDTEVILGMYDFFGEACVDQFNGQWAFAIYDPSRAIVFCSRDRFGIKPFYYWQAGEDFYFSSEIKAFTVLKDWCPKPNYSRVYDFLVHAMHDHTSDTFFRDVKQLGKGSNGIYDLSLGTFDTAAYYDLSSIEITPIPESEAIDRFNFLLDDSIALRSRSDVRVGSTLSGGLDSATVTLRMNRKGFQALDTFSIVYTDPKISEGIYLNAVLQKGNFNAHLLSPNQVDFEKVVEDLVWHQEEPFAGMGVFAQFMLFREIKKYGIKVVLGGQGADEILGGYDKFYLPIFKSEIRKRPLNALQLLSKVIVSQSTSPVIISRRLLSYFKRRGHDSIDWLAFEDGPTFVPPPESTVLQMSKNLLSNLGIGALLRYEDKNAMAHGVESRLPYLDHRLVEFCLSLPDQYKIRDGVRKWILRESGNQLLPDILLKRYSKLGFATPEEKWMRDRKEYYQKTIERLGPLVSRYVKLDKVSLFGDRELRWRVFVFAKWLERFNLQ